MPHRLTGFDRHCSRQVLAPTDHPPLPNYSQAICLELQLISAENRLHASHQPVFNALGARRNEFITKETEMPCGLVGLDP